MSGSGPVSESTSGGLAAPGQITDLLNYRLSRLNAFAGAAPIRLCEGKFGVSRREWHILGLLAAHGARAPSQLADASHLDRARVSRAISQLRSKGLIQRRPVLGDQRRASVELTNSGMRMYERIFRAVARLNVDLVSAIDPTILAAFDRALSELTEQAQLQAHEAGAGIKANRYQGIAKRQSTPDLDDD